MSAAMDRRQCSLMRQFVELATTMVEIGDITTREAADFMKAYGVPLHVALRALTGRRI